MMLASPASSSPANIVASNDDLLTEILVRLPLRSLLRSKSVSKHWYFLIVNPSFIRLRNPAPDPPSGLFIPILFNKSHMECEFVPFDVQNPVKPPFKTLNFDLNANRIDIEHSSNGIMICHSHDVDVIDEIGHAFTHKYYIYNPTLNHFTTLPRLENYDNASRFGMTIAFDPSKSPHYKIVYVCGLESDPYMGDSSYQMEIYSSETRNCRPLCRFSLDVEIDMDFRAGVYWNDAIHWIHRKGFVLYIKLDEERLHRIQTPPKPLAMNAKKHSKYIFESRDHMLLVDIFRPHTSVFNIYELKRDYSAWSVKYHVDLGEVIGEFPDIVNPLCGITFEFAVLSLVLGEIEDDSFLVLEIPGKAIRFNLESKTFHKLYDFTSCRLNNGSDSNMVFTQWPYVFQFRECLYGV